MSEEKAEPLNSMHLEEIVQCVKEVGNKEGPTERNLQNLYGDANQLISNFETNINRCKRYNEAKINRKYEMVISDLESEVRKLNQKLRIQQDARSPTKKHVADILDQLVVYKEENDRLKKQLSEMKQRVQELTNKNENQSLAIKQLQTTQPKAMVQRLPSINPGATISDGIKSFLKDKEEVRKMLGNREKSEFQKFLHLNLPKSWNWTVSNLMEEIDKWSDGIKPSRHVDMWKIRSSVARSFSECLDDSTTLTRPASFTKNILKPIGTEKRILNKKQSRFSVFGDRSEKSMMDPLLH